MQDPKPDSALSELEGLLNSVRSRTVMDTIFGATPSGALIACAPDGLILRASDFAVQLHGRPQSDLVGHTLADDFGPTPVFDSSGRPLPAAERPLGRALRGETVTGFELELETPDGERIPLISNAAPIFNAEGELIGAISSITDVRPQKALQQALRETLAQREEMLEQRETLYRELTHRVKNHLQIMSALIALEARRPAASAKHLADQLTGQLQTLAAVYSSMDSSEAGVRIEARGFVEKVCRPYVCDTIEVRAEVDPPELTLASEQAGPVGMLVNEAVCNSCKYAFTDRSGRVRVSLRRLAPDLLRLEVTDNGAGWGAVDPTRSSHGLDLMRTFAKQLHSELELGVHEGGALVAVEFPEVAS